VNILREIKQPGRETDYSSPSNAEGKYFLHSFVSREYAGRASRFDVSVTVRLVDDILGSRSVQFYIL
jgi:hypothetical protein